MIRFYLSLQHTCHCYWRSLYFPTYMCLPYEDRSNSCQIKAIPDTVLLQHTSRIMRKTVFAYANTKAQLSFAVIAKPISAFVFAIPIVQSLYFLNPKFQASYHLLWLYNPVCMGPGKKKRRPVFSHRGSYLPLLLEVYSLSLGCTMLYRCNMINTLNKPPVVFCQ